MKVVAGRTGETKGRGLHLKSTIEIQDPYAESLARTGVRRRSRRRRKQRATWTGERVGEREREREKIVSKEGERTRQTR